MAYKFQLGDAIMSGALAQEGAFEVLSDINESLKFRVARNTANVSGSGTMYMAGAVSLSSTLAATGSITAGTSFIIGSADLNETDMEKLDGITDGTAAANKAVVLDGSKNIATIGTVGCGAITSTGGSTFASAKVSDLTSGRVLLAGTSGELEDNAKLTFDGADLALGASTRILAVDYSGSGVFQNVGAVSVVGAMASSGSITAGSSFIIGSADLNETDMEKLDGITNGTAAANKAVVLDGSKNIATIGTIGCGAITSTGASSYGTLTGGAMSGSGTFQNVGAAVFGAAMNVSGNMQVDGTVVNFPNVAAAALDAADLVLSLDSGTKDLQVRTRTSVVSDMAGVGLGAASGVLSLDLNELTAAAVDVAADSIAIIDANDSNASRKESIADLATAMAGAGISAVDGVLSTDAAVSSTSFGDANATLAEGLNFGSATFTADRTLTLPASPSTNDIVRVKAPASLGGFDCLIQKGSSDHRIDGQEIIRLESNGGAVTMQFVGSNTWLIY